MCDKGGRGPKNPKICVMSFMDGPLGHVYALKFSTLSHVARNDMWIYGNISILDIHG